MANEKKTPQEIIDEAIAKGAVLSVMYFDVSAKDKEAVQASLAELVGRISKEQGVISAVGEIEEPIDIEGMWSSAAEVTVLAKNFQTLANVAIRYGPIGVEIIRPDYIKLSLGEAQSMLLNISQIGQDFAQYVITKMMTEEEKERFKKQQAARIELGKKLLQKKNEQNGG